jgi:CheY-like chemotaxis protein
MKARDEPVNEGGKGNKANGILLAEYSSDDAYLIRYVFNEISPQHELKVVRDGGDVINYLNGAALNSDCLNRKIPDVLLLDLNLPLIDGFDVLRWIRTQPRLKDLPVVILTDCDFVEDVNRAYHLGAYSFFVKSPRFEDAVRHCLSLQRYRQDVKTDKDAKMPRPVWPREHALSPFRPGLSEQPRRAVGK